MLGTGWWQLGDRTVAGVGTLLAGIHPGVDGCQLPPGHRPPRPEQPSHSSPCNHGRASVVTRLSPNRVTCTPNSPRLSGDGGGHAQTLPPRRKAQRYPRVSSVAGGDGGFGVIAAGGPHHRPCRHRPRPEPPAAPRSHPRSLAAGIRSPPASRRFPRPSLHVQPPGQRRRLPRATPSTGGGRTRVTSGGSPHSPASRASGSSSQ